MKNILNKLVFCESPRRTDGPPRDDNSHDNQFVFARSEATWQSNLRLFLTLLVTFNIVTMIWGQIIAGNITTIEQNMAKTVTFEQKVSEVFVSNPEIADVQINNAKLAYIFGKTPGQTSVIAVDAKGNKLLETTVVVTHNIDQLKSLIYEAAPDDFVEVRSVPGGIVLEGTVENPTTSENIKNIAERYLGDKQILVNHLSVRAPIQVNLRVKVAEVNRTVLNSLGFNWQNFFNFNNFTFGFLSGRTVAARGASNIASVTGDSFGGNLSSGAGSFVDNHNDINSIIDALSKEQLVTILAEPNLVAVSGETASFLAGGEFPYPVPQSDGTITIEFKQFGVSLAFTPTVLGDKLISMKVRPEVSELDDSRSVELTGFRVPGISTRRAETTIELGSGQSFAIAGLLKDTVTSDIAGTPGLSDVPILGSLFRSNNFKRGETELVIIVTPYLVNPVSADQLSSPLDGLNYASFVEQVVERKLNNEAPNGGMPAPIGQNGKRLIGPAGFSIE